MDEETMRLLSQLTNVDDLSDLPGAISAPEPEEFEMPAIREVDSNPGERAKDLDADYATVRDNAHFQQQLLRMAALKAFENANMSDAPRMMEVFSTLMTQMTNNNKQFLDMHKQMKDITQQEVTTTPNAGSVQSINAETAVFVGSAKDLLSEVGSRQEYLRAKKNEEVIDDVTFEEVQKEDD